MELNRCFISNFRIATRKYTMMGKFVIRGQTYVWGSKNVLNIIKYITVVKILGRQDRY